MTPDEQALLAAVHADPDDDLPRLVYADWLEERGGEAEVARAEFIRLHVRLATLDERDPKYDALDRRCRELLERHWVATGGEDRIAFASRYHYHQMHRGFSDHTFLSDTDLDDPKFLACLLHDTCSDVTLYNLKPDSPLPDWPGLRNVRKLDFYSDVYERDVASVRRLLASPMLGGLRELDLNHASGLSDDDAELVTLNPHFANLRSLTAAGRELGEQFVAGVVTSPYLHGLTALSLWSMSLPPDVVRSLADAPFFPHLRELRLSLTRWNDADVNHSLVELLSHPHLGPLERLDLRYNRLTDADLVACGVPVRFPQLGRLALDSNRLTSETMARILASPHADRLVELNLSENDLSCDWPRDLSGSTMRSLRRLTLRGCDLSATVVEQLASSPAMQSVRELDLEGNPIGDAGAIALARSPYLRQLQVIHLQGCQIGRDGIRALATAAFARRISGSDLQRNRVEGEWLIVVGPVYFGWSDRDISVIQFEVDLKQWTETGVWPESSGNS